MFYTVYQITNRLNGKIYIGCHKTKNLDDDYMGSGKILRRAIAKYGIENFEKKILEVFETAEQMFDRERALVIIGGNSYNLCEGGNGGFDYINRSGLKHCNGKNLEARRKISSTMMGRKHPPATIELKKRWASENPPTPPSFAGKSHTNETRQKIGQANSVKQKGERNSNYGNVWIHHLEKRTSKRIPKTEIDSFVSQGWISGRKMKFE